MRIFLVHDQFEDIDGHYFQECLAWRKAGEVLGVEVRIFVSGGLDSEIASQLNAYQVFPSSAAIRGRYSLPPTVGVTDEARYFTEFLNRSRAVAEGCHLMGDSAVTARDVVVFAFSDAAALNGAADWLVDLEPERRPRVVFNFHKPEATLLATPDRSGLEGLRGLLVASGRRVKGVMPADKVLLTAVDARLAAALRQMLDLPCVQCPMAQHFGALEDRRAAGGRGGAVVSAMGIARLTKGAQNLALIAANLFDRRPDAGLFLQCQTPAVAEHFRAAMKQLNCDHAIDIALVLSSQDYYAQIERSDLILLPYLSRSYAVQSSGVFSDAVGAGVPVVAPANTWMSDRLAEGWGAGVAFVDERPAGVVDAIVGALDALPALRTKASASAAAWREAHSAQRYLAFLLQTLAPPANVED